MASSAFRAEPTSSSAGSEATSSASVSRMTASSSATITRIGASATGATVWQGTPASNDPGTHPQNRGWSRRRVGRRPRPERRPIIPSEMSSREIRAPRGNELTCKAWPQEAALRMLMNNLDPDVAERPEDLVVYGGTGRAARSWEAFDAIVRTLRDLESDETLLVQSGKPVAVFRTHPMAPRVLISNAMIVPKWADWDTFRELEAAGLTMYGQMTAGSWIYIGTQGILQGTYETFAEAAS